MHSKWVLITTAMALTVGLATIGQAALVLNENYLISQTGTDVYVFEVYDNFQSDDGPYVSKHGQHQR